MSKTWSIPKTTEQRIETLRVNAGDKVKAGDVVAEMRILKFQGEEMPVSDSFPPIPVKAPDDGVALFWPDARKGVSLKEGRKVFSILSELELKLLDETAGEAVRRKMFEAASSFSYEGFEELINAVSEAQVGVIVQSFKKRRG